MARMFSGWSLMTAPNTTGSPGGSVEARQSPRLRFTRPMEPDDPRHPTWTLRITAGADGPAHAHARGQRFDVGDALSFDEAYPHATALEHALAAAGAELVNGLRALARLRRLELDAVEALVQGKLEDALAHLGVVGASGSP